MEGQIYNELVSSIKNGKIVEVGSYEGLSLSYIKNAISSNNNQCWSVDILATKQLLKNTKKWGINFMHMSSENASSNFEDNSLDLVFIDADHEYESVKKDILLWHPKIKDDGIIAGHDYSLDPVHWPGVRKAVDEFFPNKITHQELIWIFKKV